MYNCPYCTECSAISFKKLLRHIKFVHSCEPNFSVTCGQCQQSFKKFETFKSHLRRRHSDVNEDNRNLLNVETFQHFESNDANVLECEDDRHAANHQNETQESVSSITRFIALYILKIKEENQLTQQVMNSILENTECLVEQSLDALKNDIKLCLADNNIDISNINGLRDVLNQKSLFSRARNPLESEYMQVKYFVENFNFVVSITMHLMKIYEN